MYFKVLEFGGATHTFLFPYRSSSLQSIGTVEILLDDVWKRLPAVEFTAQVMFAYDRWKSVLTRNLLSNDYTEVSKLVGDAARMADKKLRYGTIYVKIVSGSHHKPLIALDDFTPANEVTKHLWVVGSRTRNLAEALYNIRRWLVYKDNLENLEKLDI